MSGSDVEAIYPLTPMQGGMLFHSLYNPESDVYFGQAHWPITGPLDVPTFHAAWQEVVQRHSILRTSFEWSRSSGPMQLVHRTVDIPLDYLDWEMARPHERVERLRQFLRADRARGFELAAAPLLRITVIRNGADDYRVVWSGHHLLVDGRSINLVLREVMAIYTARLDGTSPSLPTPVPYSRFVSWLAARDEAATEQFWRHRLRGFTAPTSFRLQGEAVRNHPHQGATESEELRLSAKTRAALRRLARSAGVTLNTVITGAWAILSSRYSTQDDVVFGVTIGSGGIGAPLGRSLIGLVINTLPLRVQIGSAGSTVTFLQQLQTSMIELRQYAHSSLVDVTRWSDLPTGTPLFDTIAVFNNASLDRLRTDFGAVKVGRITIEQHSSYPLNLVVQPGAELTLKLIYAPEHLEQGAAQRLAGNLEQALDSMTAEPESPPRRLSVLAARERRAIMIDWNATGTQRSAGVTLRDMFSEQVRRTPQAIAVSGAGRHLTYAQLDRQTNDLAHRLRQSGAGPETIVAIALERSIELVVGMVAVTKAGAACLFLDPHGPQRRNAYLLEDAGAALCITHSSLGTELRDKQHIIHIDDPPVCSRGDAAPQVEISDSNLAYVIYTSGTTGPPKGVAIEHRNAVNLVAWHTDTFGVTSMDRVTQIAGVGFDALIWEIWPNLAAGACICIPPDDVRGVPKRLQWWLTEKRITITFAPTPLAEALLSLDWPATTSLRTMLVGGDVLHRGPAGSLPFQVINNYGPSECTVVTTSGLVPPAPTDRVSLPSIGRPIANVEVYLLNGDLEPVPVGVPGEMYIGGAGVGRGYLNRPRLTAERFVAHPFSLDPGARLYRSGDLARYLEDGTIAFMGRLDDQVQLRGFRIEPGEIESALRDHLAVRDAVVAAQPDHRGNTTLAAYIVSTDGAPLPITSLRDHLAARLPDYMIPSALVAIDEVPLSPNGKVDRSALPPPPQVHAAPDISPAPPTSEVEELLQTIWKSTLRLETVSRDDNFFALGGNSLLAIELLERIRLGLGLELSLSDIFRTPTIAGLATLNSSTESSVRRTVVVPIQPLGTRPPFFCAAPVLGTVFPYYELAHAMDTDQPFYGLQPVELLGDRASLATIERIASRYIDAMRQVQSSGPYYLGGWSFGGLVAFEMAQQLQRAGEEIALVVVLDTPAPGLQHYLRPHQSAQVVAQTVLGGALGYFRDYEYLASGSKERSGTATAQRPRARRLGHVYGIAKSFVNRAAVARVVPAESRLLLYHLPTMREMLQLVRAGVRATLRYRPSIYAGRVTLLRTEDHGAEGAHTALLGWDTVSSQTVQVYPIPGNHLTLLRQPHLAAVAGVLQTALDRAYSAQSNDPAHSSSSARAVGE